MQVDYLEEIKFEMAHIKPQQEEDDTWYDEGMRYVEEKKYTPAEKKFKALIVSQPDHFDGYEGLSLVYKKTGKKDKAIYFMNKAIEIAQKQYEQGFVDKEVIKMFNKELLLLKKK